MQASHARFVAIVCDGSARWAAANGRSIRAGHEAAADTVCARVLDAIDLGVSQLTLYAFSTENWARPPAEVAALLGMLAERIARDTPLLCSHGVRIRFIGRRDRAGRALVEAMLAAERASAENDTLTVYIALDYGGRDEILAAAARYTGGGPDEFVSLLYAPDLHDPDLVIRTSGELRLSNFLLFQSAYSELVFRDESWPDFSSRSLEECLREYSLRQRRFGARARGNDVVVDLIGSIEDEASSGGPARSIPDGSVRHATGDGHEQRSTC